MGSRNSALAARAVPSALRGSSITDRGVAHLAGLTNLQMLDLVGIASAHRSRFPHEFSGGQRQRIAIARAIALKPKFLVLDEPTSALDMTIQAQIIELLKDLQQRYGITYLFVSHDLRVIRAMADEVAVMQNGKIVEAGPSADLFENPQHPYTRTLFAAAFDLSTQA